VNFSTINNASSLLAQRYTRLNAAAYNNSLMRLATGKRINRGADNPAGLIASENLSATLAALDAETSANERAMSQASTADGAIGEVSGLLTEAKRLVSANANMAGLSPEEKAANQMQLDSVLSSVNRISNTSSFNGAKLLDGSFTMSASGQKLAVASVGTGSVGKVDDGNGTTYTLSDLGTGKSLSINGGNLTTAGEVVDQAINDVATMRGQIGAYQKNTLESRLNQISTSREQLSSALSLLRDTDYAMETSQSVRYQLLSAASIKLLGKTEQQHRQHILSILA
jgi:flagellin-like hook-associated protein FlgL